MASTSGEAPGMIFKEDTAIELGHYALGLPDGTAVDEGTYLVVWKKSDEGWRLHRDIWNTNRPG